MKTYTNNGATIEYPNGYKSVNDYYSVLKINLKILLNSENLTGREELIEQYRADIATAEKAIGIN